MLKTHNIRRSFGSLEVLKGIDLEVKEKEVVSLVGASGAGKSSLLHILGTLDKPDAGTLEIEGKNPAGLSERKLADFRNRMIGFVFQFHHLLPEFTALENVCIPALIAGLSMKEAENRARKLLVFMRLDERLQHKPSALSGGEQQRVAVARALVNRPKLVLADEPSGNLDSVASVELHTLFFQLRDNFGTTFIIATHNMDLANMADRKLLIRDGIIHS